MATATKRTWKLQEFVAHATNVNCLSLGRKSGRVMVTGGEDKKVNMWAVGKPNCIMSLSGHTTPVECVRFGHAEEMVVAGSMSGALKIWDLEAAKIVRTLTGHKASIRSLVFHPYGDFVASGSLDTNIKLWDIRRKGCIYTYKGHLNTVNSLNFSPDGRWIASAGEDTCVKLWDLTAGKLLNDFKDHTGPITDVEFHPNEFLLASGSTDRTVKFWDLETFQLVSSTENDLSGSVRSLFFNPDGTCLYSAAADTLRVYGWEPTRCHDALHVGWGKVSDITVAQTQLIGAAISQTNVSIYVVDLKRVQPQGGVPLQSQSVHNSHNVPSPPHTASGRKYFNTERPPTQCSKQAKMKTEPEEESTTPQIDPGDDSTSIADIKDPEDYREIFQPRSHIRMETSFSSNSVQVNNHRRKSVSHSPPRCIDPFPAPLEDDKKSPDRPVLTHFIAADRGKPVSLDMEEFLPVRYIDTLKRKLQDVQIHQQETDMSESEAISSVLKGHDSMLTVLTNRHRNLQILHAMWTSKDLKAAVDMAVEMSDLSTLVDLLNVLSLKPCLWSLDLCTSFLPSIEKLLASKYETYVHTGCSVLKLILKNFAPVIKANISSQPSIGIDLSREERYNKCKECFDHLMTIRNFIVKKQNAKGKMGSTFRELMLLLHSLE